MINATPGLLTINDVERLRTLFVNAVEEASSLDRERRVEGGSTTRAATLDRILAARLASMDTFGSEDLIAAFSFLQGYTQENLDPRVVAAGRAALKIENAPPTHNATVNRWLKFVFFRLWVEKAVLFPLNFKVGTSYNKESLKKLLPAVVTCHLDHEQRDFASFGFRLAMAAPWYDFSDVDLDELGPFSFELGQDHDKREALGLRTRNPYSPFTAAIWTWHKHGAGQGFGYSEDDVRAYLYWMECKRRGTADGLPSEFMPNATERKVAIKAAIRRRYQLKKDAAQAALLQHDDKEELERQIREGEKSLPEVKLELAAAAVKDARDPLAYLTLLRGPGIRRSGDNPYPARMHAYPWGVWHYWNQAFDKYFEHRKRAGYEETSAWDSFRYVFQDYLCCYLPWWFELNPESDAPLPGDPSEFERFGMWIEGPEDRSAPLPLLRFFDAVRVGKGADGLNGFVNDVRAFFEFCRAYAPRFAMRRKEFPNPVSPEFDRVLARGPQKTTKNPIPKPILPYLLRYAYAVEGFFGTMQDRAVADELTLDEQRRLRRIRYEGGMQWYDPAEWGPVGFEFEGQQFTIPAVPGLAMWSKVHVQATGRQRQKVFIPQLSGLRMVIAALETGLRLQGIQWLCRKTFNSLNGPEFDGAELVPLVVSTDKTKDKPWKTLIVRRAHDLLMREEAFQSLLADAHVDRMVPYERREHTRFGMVLPLFRAPYSDYPVADRTYALVWERLIVGFGLWYEKAVPGAEPLRMWRFEPHFDQRTGEPKVMMHVDDDGTRPYCPLKLRLQHTPHSARATFITARSGLLPVEVTAELVGHNNTATTYYYTVESPEEVEAKILAAANSVWSPDPENPVHIRADEVNSALRQSFEADRARTEAAFGFQTLALLNKETSEDNDGVALLRSTPMGNIVFRETHICPVGELCPSDVLETIIEPRRCGLCPLAVKSVDHLPSIGARMRRLLEQVREGSSLIERMRKRGEPLATVEEVHERRKLDVLEFEGWRTSLLGLNKALEDLEHAPEDVFVAGKPEAVKHHLSLVTRDVEMGEFIVQRIVDSFQHPLMESSVVKAQAARLRQRLLASQQAVDNEIEDLDDDPVEAFLSSLKVTLKARRIAPTFRAALEAVRSNLALDRREGPKVLPQPTEV